MSREDSPVAQDGGNGSPLPRLAARILPQAAVALGLLAFPQSLGHADVREPGRNHASPPLGQRLSAARDALRSVLTVSVEAGRPLSPGEIAESKPLIFGDRLDYDKVRVRAYDHPALHGGSAALVQGRIFTVGNSIYVPRQLYDQNYAGMAFNPIPHELTHVWQHQSKGMSLVGQAAGLLAQTWSRERGGETVSHTAIAALKIEWQHRHESGITLHNAASLVEKAGEEYAKAYEPDKARRFSQQNIEQQASMVERYAEIAHRADTQRQLPGEAVLHPTDVEDARALRTVIAEELPVRPIDFSPDPRDAEAAYRHRRRAPVLVAKR